MQMNIIIREYDKKDEAELKNLMALCSVEHDFFNILSSPYLKCAYSAISHKKIVGAIFAWHSTFHPHCTYLKMLIHPHFKFERIAKKMLLIIDRQPDLIQPLQTLVEEDAVAYCDFFESNGFVEIRKTFLPLIPVQHQSVLESSDLEYTVKSLGEIHTDKYFIEKLTDLVKFNYEETHLDNPVAEIALDKWKQLIFADDLIMDGSLLYIDETTQKILAYSFLHESEEDDRLELGWCGSERNQHIQLISELLSAQKNYAQKQGYHFIVGECDTTSPFAMEVFRSIGTPKCKTLITYQHVM